MYAQKLLAVITLGSTCSKKRLRDSRARRSRGVP